MTMTVSAVLYRLALEDPSPETEALIDAHLAKRPGGDRGAGSDTAALAARARGAYCGEYPEECACGGVGHSRQRHGPAVAGITVERGSP
jgi:hypothetical protein